MPGAPKLNPPAVVAAGVPKFKPPAVEAACAPKLNPPAVEAAGAPKFKLPAVEATGAPKLIPARGFGKEEAVLVPPNLRAMFWEAGVASPAPKERPALETGVAGVPNRPGVAADVAGAPNDNPREGVAFEPALKFSEGWADVALKPRVGALEADGIAKFNAVDGAEAGVPKASPDVGTAAGVPKLSPV